MQRSAETHHHLPQRNRGFSLLELLLVIVLISLLFLVAFERLLPLRGEAESAHVSTVIGTLRSALGMETAARVTREGLAGLPPLYNINPFDLLEQQPENYLGEIEHPEHRDITPGSWYFDKGEQNLVYRVRFPQYLDGAPDGPIELRWRISQKFEAIAPGRQNEQVNDRPRRPKLAPLHEFP